MHWDADRDSGISRFLAGTCDVVPEDVSVFPGTHGNHDLRSFRARLLIVKPERDHPVIHGIATDLITDLEHRGLIVVDHLTDETRSVAAEMPAVIAELADPVWQSLDPDDSAATERVLNTVLEDLRDKLELELLVVANGHPL